MEQTGMWNLFFATGLPEAYLAAKAREEKKPEVFPPMPPPGMPGSLAIPPTNLAGEQTATQIGWKG